MSLTIKDNSRHFQVAPQGLHIARCYAVIDLGKQFNKKYKSFFSKVLIGWELSSTLMPDGKPFIHMQSYTGSISENAKLRPLLENWRGKAFTEAESKGFKLHKLLGAPCCLVTKHTSNPQSSQTWSHIIALCKLPPTVECPPPVNPPVYFDLDDYSEAAYLSVSAGIRKKINLEGITAIAENTSTVPADTAPQANSDNTETPVGDYPF